MGPQGQLPKPGFQWARKAFTATKDSQRTERIEWKNARAVCNRPRKEIFDCVLTIQSRLAGWLLDTPSKIFDYLQIASTITRRYFQDHHNAKRNAR
jgi:hypothetical protein